MGAASRPHPALVTAIAGALLALVAWLVWSPVLELALFGWDSYPLILAGRVRDGAEFWGTFGEELMDGAYPLGHFYRPLTHLAFGFDHARVGTEASGFHATDLAILVASALALFLVARRLLGPAAWPFALMAGLVFLAHPVQLEILPVPARRAEGLSVLFSLLAIVLQPLPERPARTRSWLAAACCLCAVASKETGAVACGYVACLALVASRGVGLSTRLRDALRVAWPTLVLFALFVAARTSVLGGLGGSEETSLTANLGSAPRVLFGYLGGLALEGAPWLRAVVLACLAWALLVLARGADAEAEGAPPEPQLGAPRVALFVLLAVLLIGLMTSLSGLERGWYALPFLPWLVLALVLCLAWARPAWKAGARAPVLVGGLLSLALMGSNVARVLARGDLAAFRAASADQADFLARFDQAVQAGAGRRSVVAGLPTERQAVPGDPDSRKLIMLAPYSVEAYAALRFPNTRVRIELVGRGGGPPAPDEVVVVLAP